MLPFLKNKQERGVGGISVQVRKPDQPEQIEKREGDQEVEAAAKDLIDALATQDVKKVAQALRAAFEIMDSLPHVEGEHTNESED